MTDVSAAAPSSDSHSTASFAGIIAQEERAAIDALRSALRDAGVDPGAKPIELRALPFEGTWGGASTIARMVAGDLVNRELDAAGELEGLSKKEIKKKVNERVNERAQLLASEITATLAASGSFAKVESANGYINIFYDANTVAARLIGEVLERGERYGWAPEGSHPERVMIEHSQLNTHKAAHVGHLRNICLGVAVTNISRAGGYTTMPVTYIGDIGRHVIRCLWCYANFHRGEEPAGDAPKGRWLGDIYAESDARLNFRKDVLDFLESLFKEDEQFALTIDRMLKFLWREGTVDGEDIAYLLGRVTQQLRIDVAELRDENVLVTFWPMIGNQLRDESEQQETTDRAALIAAENDNGEIVEPFVDTVHSNKPTPIEPPAPSMDKIERYAEWQRIAEHMADWWPHGPRWEQEVKDTFQLWETKDPAFVELWKVTREWSLDDLRLIFAEFGATFDAWFYESEVEDDGRKIVGELLERGIAEISDGLPVVKIDEKLGLDHETYRTMPILRSDGTTLYSTKDLALTQKKFIDYDVDRAIWVVDVRQSLYFDQISKILELYGFGQAANTMHLGYEFVTLPSGIMSSRKGNAPMLEDVRDAMLARALAVIQDKNPELPLARQQEVARQVAIGAIKYVMLARDGNKVIVFDPDEALSFEGHAAPYVQYAHARACRILEHADATDATIEAALSALDFGTTAPEELGLLQAIADFPGVVQRAADEYRPLHMTNYVFEIAKRFNDFYHACPVLHSAEPTRTARLALVAATRRTLKNGLALLGIDAPEQM
ncbi:MAG: arginine--tRNA ligase [Thermomicrobiales bacterium]